MSKHIYLLTTERTDVNCERYTCACLYCKSAYRPSVVPDIADLSALQLADEVFVVKGAKYHCLYDLPRKMLYRLDQEAFLAMQSILVGGEVSSDVGKETAAFLEQHGWPEPLAIQPPPGEPQPTFALLQATDLCNLKCIHCYEDAKYDSKDYHTLSLQDAVYAMDELRAIGVRHLQITGGEPLCNPDIMEITRYACGHFETVEFYSNCLLMSDEFAAFLREQGATVALSIYSYQAMDHDFVTLGRRSHERTMKALEILDRHGLKRRISTILLDGIELGERGEAPFDLTEKQDAVRLVGRAGIAMLDEDNLERKFITAKTFSSELNREDVLFNMACHNCFGYVLYISSRLEVRACPMEMRLIHGSLTDRTPGLLQETLNRNIQNLSKDNINGCRDCEFRYACFDCRPDSMDRSVDAQPWYCAYHPESGVWDNDIREKVIKWKHAYKDEVIASAH